MARCEQCLSEKVCRYNDGINLYCKEDYECPHFKNKADFLEVKHGRWKRVRWVKCDDPDGGYWIVRCNQCSIPHFKEYNYCPSCGAKMDVSKKEITTEGGKAE